MTDLLTMSACCPPDSPGVVPVIRCAGRWFSEIAPQTAMAGAGYDWVVCTGTDQLRNSFHRLGIVTQILADADPARLPDGGAGWGQYYEHHPVVVAIKVADGPAALQQAGLLRVIQLVAPEGVDAEDLGTESVYGRLA